MESAPAREQHLPARLFETLYRIRRVEEEVARIYPTDRIKSPVHLSIGQEAVSVGVCMALQQDDIVFGTYRGHALYLAKGGDLKKMFAELYGKATGCAKGKGGSMHLVDVEHGVMVTSAVVGTTIPNAVGYALAARLQQRNIVVASFFGDGAVEEGVFQESLNFAALKGIPILFVCENNEYAIHSPRPTRQANLDICARVEATGVPAIRLESDDAVQVYEHAAARIRDMREGRSGPQFMECPTYRWKEHVGPNEDFKHGYRRVSEAEPWMAADQARLLGERLASAVRQQIETRVEAEIREAIAFAEASPWPAAEELYTDVYLELS